VISTIRRRRMMVLVLLLMSYRHAVASVRAIPRRSDPVAILGAIFDV
jgi:hypothetical protein